MRTVIVGKIGISVDQIYSALSTGNEEIVVVESPSITPLSAVDFDKLLPIHDIRRNPQPETAAKPLMTGRIKQRPSTLKRRAALLNAALASI